MQSGTIQLGIITKPMTSSSKLNDVFAASGGNRQSRSAYKRGVDRSSLDESHSRSILRIDKGTRLKIAWSVVYEWKNKIVVSIRYL